MTFKESVKTNLGQKYFFVMAGRASRSEFWWFMLFIFCVNLCCGLILSIFPPSFSALVSFAVSLVLLPPNLGVTVRRLHDRNLSGWWVLAPILTLVLGIGGMGMLASVVCLGMCLIYLIILCMPGTPGVNRFGAPTVEAIKN